MEDRIELLVKLGIERDQAEAFCKGIVNRNEAKLDVTSSCRKQFNDWYKDYYKTYDQSIARYVTSKIVYKHKK